MIMHNGIYIKKIAAIGSDKATAQVDFNKGLNVVSGASNTGKSYLLECINYIFGAKDSPKAITESKGYDQIRAEIHTYDNQVFTVSRQFNDKYVYLAKTTFENFNTSEAQKFSSTHNEKNDVNLSKYLLNLLGLNGKKLKKNNYNVTRALSFRDLSRFCLVSEEKIIKSSSLIYTGQKMDETVNKSLFKLLLSGKDDDELELIENQDIVKSRINGKIELIQDTIKEKEKKLFEIKNKVDSLKNDEINMKIEGLVKLVNNTQKEILEEEQKRQVIWSELDSIRSALNQSNELKKRFELLNTHYASDLTRLEFINEGKQYINQLEKINCPLCNNLIEQKLLEPYEDSDQIVLDSIKSEFLKIKAKQTELIETINNIDKTRSDLLSKVTLRQTEFEEVNQHISNKLKPIHEANNENLQTFLKLRYEKGQIEMIEEDITKLKSDTRYYAEKLNEKQKTAPETIMPEQIYSNLSIEIKNILSTWGINCNTIYYDPTVNDIEIDGEKRPNFGKGFRAIYLSAFMIAVMFFCLKNDLKHPYFLVLDSPLTSFKERDSDQGGIDKKDESVSEDIQNRFYQSLSNLQNINDVQIIVIDNKDPPEGLKSKIRYEHFSKNTSKGRYGFYPMSSK